MPGQGRKAAPSSTLSQLWTDFTSYRRWTVDAAGYFSAGPHNHWRHPRENYPPTTDTQPPRAGGRPPHTQRFWVFRAASVTPALVQLNHSNARAGHSPLPTQARLLAAAPGTDSDQEAASLELPARPAREDAPQHQQEMRGHRACRPSPPPLLCDRRSYRCSCPGCVPPTRTHRPGAATRPGHRAHHHTHRGWQRPRHHLEQSPLGGTWDIPHPMGAAETPLSKTRER